MAFISAEADLLAPNMTLVVSAQNLTIICQEIVFFFNDLFDAVS